jgi:hypothetical protein
MSEQPRAFFMVTNMQPHQMIPFKGVVQASGAEMARSTGGQVAYVVTGDEKISKFEAAIRIMLGVGSYTRYNQLPRGFHESDITPVHFYL